MAKYRYINYEIDNTQKVLKINITDGQYFSDKQEVIYWEEGNRPVDESQVKVLNAVTFVE